jgi:hypothetical protein
MRTRTSSEQLEAESVWGIEVMDPLEQVEWALSLYQKMDAPLSVRKPLLLIYSPVAERAAIRGLNTLSRIARRRGIPAFFTTPRLYPMLNLDPPPSPALQSIHRASRFVNLLQWLKRQLRADSRIVITAPVDEYLSISRYHDFELVHVPEEEPTYCERKAGEILEKVFPSLSNQSDKRQSSLVRVLAEAGIAGVPAPLSLLARHYNLDCEGVIKLLKAPGLLDLIEIVEDPAVTGAAAIFRGRWLAEKIAPDVRSGHYASLYAMLADSDSRLPNERFFFLTVLVALRAQGADAETGRLLKDFYHHFHAAAVAADRSEREAWRCFHKSVLPLFLSE